MQCIYSCSQCTVRFIYLLNNTTTLKKNVIYLARKKRTRNKKIFFIYDPIIFYTIIIITKIAFVDRYRTHITNGHCTSYAWIFSIWIATIRIIAVHSNRRAEMQMFHLGKFAWGFDVGDIRLLCFEVQHICFFPKLKYSMHK